MGDTDFLFAMPSFFNGIARTIDLFGFFTDYNISSTITEADSVAFAKDVQAIRQDMSKAFEELEKKVNG